MNLSQVKLVVTDMDGTLLNSKHEVSSQFFKLFAQLKNHIHFVAASGRQYHSIIDKLASIKDEITVIAENGGISKQGNQELMITRLTDKKIQQLIPIIRKLNGGYAILCGKHNAYIEAKDQHFISLFKEYYPNYKMVSDLTKVSNDDFLKIAVYHAESSKKYLYPTFKKLGNDTLVKISGQNWLDISNPKANKGHALKHLQDTLGIRKEETMVFGDYENDLEMLELAHFSYAMQNAVPRVKKIARFETKSNDELGVESVLEQLLKAKS